MFIGTEKFYVARCMSQGICCTGRVESFDSHFTFAVCRFLSWATLPWQWRWELLDFSWCFLWVQFNLHIFQWVATCGETPYFHGWTLDRASKRYAAIPWKGRGWSLSFFPCFSDGLLQPHPEDASENFCEARGHDQPRLGSGFVVDGCRW